MPIGAIILHLPIFTFSYMKILYLQHIPWGWIKQRPHFIAEGLAEKHDLTVAYRLGVSKKGVTVKNETSVNIKPLYRLPLERFPLIRKVNSLLYNWQLRKQMKECDVVWLTAPDILNCCSRKALSSKIVAYDCMDDMLEFKVSPQALNNLRECEEWLMHNADIVFASSHFLKETLVKRYCDRDITVLNNAIKRIEEIRHTDAPKEFVGNDKKKLVYIGTISSWFDFDAIGALLDARKDIEVHLYGISEIDIPKIEGLYFHGPVEHNLVFGIMSAANILLMPFKVTPLIKSVNPVKLYEYIYSGKPSIAPLYGESEKFSDYVYLYNSKDEFVSLTNNILSQGWKHKKSPEECKQFAAHNTWACRVEEILKILSDYKK